jgi:hypothetical protein
VSCRPSKGDRDRPYPRPSPHSDQNSLREFRQKDGALVTEIGFVSLLVAGFGALAGALVYLGVRLSRGRS